MGNQDENGIHRGFCGKADRLEAAVPWSDKFHALLKSFCSWEEMEVLSKIPVGLTAISELGRNARSGTDALCEIMNGLATKGLVVDLWIDGSYYYTPAPILVGGLSEFDLVRLGQNPDANSRVGLFPEYREVDASYFAVYRVGDEQVTLVRALPYENAVLPAEYFEILDYGRVAALVEAENRFSLGLCSCCHERLPVEESCGAPQECCSYFGHGAEIAIRLHLAREITRSEMKDRIAQSREMGLVPAVALFQNHSGLICHCCKCCCRRLVAMRTYGYPSCVVSSEFLAEVVEQDCMGCGKCVDVCPGNSVSMTAARNSDAGNKKLPRVDTAVCLGCGVCAHQCPCGAIKMRKLGQRVIRPEVTFERIMLQCLDAGTMQSRLFSSPQYVDDRYMRAFIGAFLKLSPGNMGHLNELLRSRYLDAMRSGIKRAAYSCQLP